MKSRTIKKWVFFLVDSLVSVGFFFLESRQVNFDLVYLDVLCVV